MSNNELRKEISKRVLRIMKAIDMDQIELSKKSKLTPAAISQIINGKRTPSLESIVKISNVFGCRVGRLINE